MDEDDLHETIKYAAGRIARSITDDAGPGHDATGGTVACLTEAIMGITAGLSEIASAINRLADAHER